MELMTANKLLEHGVRFLIMILGIGFAVFLGRFRSEWRSRKTLICWIWTIAAIDVMIMDGEFATTLTAQMFIGGALVLNTINFIGDRIETIKFKDFTASLGKEGAVRPEPTPAPPAKEKWPDGGSISEDQKGEN
jgi:hypothetical protein